VGFLMTFSGRVRHSRAVEWMFAKMPLGNYGMRIFDTVHRLGEHPGPLAAASVLAMASQGLTVAILLTLAWATSPGDPVARAAIVVPLGLLANTVPLTPGGLGIGEAAFDRLFRIAGMVSGAEAMLSWRLLTTVLSLLGLLFYLQGRERVVHGRKTADGIETTARES
jgi:glycosyltransferase 2 family protein